MEINPKPSRKKTINPEGSVVLERKPEIQLYLEASNLNLKKNSFYVHAQTKLDGLLELAKSKDINEDYVLGLAKFLSDKGLKTSPVLLLSSLSDRKMSFRGIPVGKVFNTPQRIAEAIALHDLKKVKLNNSFKKNILKKALEEMQVHTLKKNKLRRRKIKTADLIKLLRPKPKTKEMANIYKALIENSNEVSLKDEENMVSIKSSTKLNKEKKKELVEKNLDKIPLNQLIRNLKFLADEYDFKENLEVQKKVHARLSSIDNYKFLNIFDVITASIFVPQFEKLLQEIVKKFVNEIKSQFEFDENSTVLFDVSGSMMGEGIERGFKYLVLFAELFDNLDVFAFSNDLITDNRALSNVIKNIKNGNLQTAYRGFEKYARENMGGTALIQSTRDLLSIYPTITNLIVITDEVSWLEGFDLTSQIDEMAKILKDKKLTLINPVVYKGTVFKGNMISVSALNPSILLDMAVLYDESGFIRHIKEIGTKLKAKGKV
jgi:hypothetical protein